MENLPRTKKERIEERERLNQILFKGEKQLAALKIIPFLKRRLELNKL